MISKLAKRRAANAMKAQEARLNRIKSLNESVESAKPDVLNEHAAATFNLKNTKRRNLINNIHNTQERNFDKFSDGLTEIITEAFCFDQEKLEEMKNATRDNVKKFVNKLFHEGLIEVNDITKNPSMVVKIFAEEVTKDLDKNKASEIEKPCPKESKEAKDNANKIEEIKKKDSKEAKNSDDGKTPTKTVDNLDPKSPDFEKIEEKKNMAYDDGDVKKAKSKAVKMIAEAVKEKVTKNVERNIEIAKEAKRKIDEVKQAKDDALSEKMVNEEMENFNPKKFGEINPHHFQIVCDLLNEDFVDDELESDETDIANAEKTLHENNGGLSDEEMDELDEITDDEDADEEEALMKVVAADAEFSYNEDVMHQIEVSNKKATTRAETVLMNGIKRGLIKDHKANTLKMFMQEAMNHANVDQDVIDADYMSFHEDFATANAIVHYTILETLNTMNLIKNEDQRDAIIEAIMN